MVCDDDDDEDDDGDDDGVKEEREEVLGGGGGGGERDKKKEEMEGRDWKEEKLLQGDKHVRTSNTVYQSPAGKFTSRA